jgi:hypothetical protein
MLLLLVRARQNYVDGKLQKHMGIHIRQTKKRMASLVLKKMDSYVDITLLIILTLQWQLSRTNCCLIFLFRELWLGINLFLGTT